MNTLTFLNQPLLWGLGLASIPILIHLLYRRQYRRLDWAPMHYLKLSIKRNRRRIRIEQILLLLLRTAIVLLLFFTVARPILNAAGLSRFWGDSGRTSRIVVLDDSLSMAYTDQGKSALARAKEVLPEVLSAFGTKDRLTLLTASRPKQPELREVELENTDEIVKLAANLPATEVFASWEGVLKAVDELIAGGSYPLHELTLFTDLRRAGWEAPLDEFAARWPGQHVKLRVIDVGSPDATNVALVSLKQVDRLALAGVPTRFEAEVRNDTAGELAGKEGNLIIDGKATVARLPNIGPRETARVPLVATMQDAGPHEIGFELPNDFLPGDNALWAVAHVQQSVDMMLVDGEPSTEPLGSETDFLALALSLSGDTSEPFRVEVITDSEWSASPQAQPDLLVLSNVSRVNAEQAELLERLVNGGMGLMVFVGDQVDPDNYNQHLFKGGRGLLGAALESVSDSEFSGLMVEPGESSPLAALAQLSPAVLSRTKFRKWYEVRLPADEPEGVHILARWNNPAAAPAVIQKNIGRGQVLLLTTTADRAWSDWPTEASYVLAVREAARAIARSTASLHELSAGEAITIEVPKSHDVTLPVVQAPGESETKPLVLSGEEPATAAASKSSAESPRASSANSPGRRTLRYTDTRRAGLYKASWRDSVAGPTSETFAVNPDVRESQLERMPVEELKKLWGAMEPEVISLGVKADAALTVHGQEIWRALATGLLGLLLIESCFARWCGRQR